MNTFPPAHSPARFDPDDTRPIVVFVGRTGGRLMDNVKYMFLEAATHDYGFAPCFLTTHTDEYALLSNAHLPVLMARHCTPKLLSRVRFAVLDDFSDKSGKQLFAALAHVPKLQLWHGIPLKKIGFPEIASGVNMTPAKEVHLRMQYSGYACVASTSPWATEHLFSHVFRAEKIEPLGYPRNDVLLRPITPFDLINSDRELFAQCKKHRKAGGKVLVYMPTFRDTGGDFLSDNALDLALLAGICYKNNILLVAKFHPYVPVESFRSLPGFVLCKSTADLYPILPLADALMTDYSSVYFDWLLLDKPALFFAYDEQKYTTKDRELFFAYEDMTPGPISRTQDALLEDILQTLVQGKDTYAEARKTLREQLFSHADANAAGRWCAYVRDNL